MKAKEFYSGVFSRQALPYRERVDRLMRSGEASSRFGVIDAVRPRPGMHILDLACGPGTITIPMARELAGEGEVIGVDLAAGMLEVAREAALGKGLPVRFLRMDIEVLQFPPGAFDAVTCAHGLQFAPNLGRTLREVRRVLKARGVFAASIPVAGEPGPAASALAAALDVRVGPAPVPADAVATRALVEDPGRLQALAVQAGLRAVEVTVQTTESRWESARQYAGMSLGWWATAARLEGLSEHVRELLLGEAAAAVEAAVGPGPFTVPVSGLLLRAET